MILKTIMMMVIFLVFMTIHNIMIIWIWISSLLNFEIVCNGR